MKYKIVADTDISDPPKEHEFSAAIIIAEYFQEDIVLYVQLTLERRTLI
jgi:hypothetical protein